MLQRATKPEERRTVMARMRSTLVQARMGVDDLRDALSYTKRKLESEQRELETVRRRKTLAAGIKDEETIKIAERFERQHEERVRVLTEKVAVQTRELELADREFSTIRDRLRPGTTGASPEPQDDDPRISPRELAAFLAGQYADAGWSRTDHYAWISGLLLELGITSLAELGDTLRPVDAAVSVTVRGQEVRLRALAVDWP